MINVNFSLNSLWQASSHLPSIFTAPLKSLSPEKWINATAIGSIFNFWQERTTSFLEEKSYISPESKLLSQALFGIGVVSVIIGVACCCIGKKPKPKPNFTHKSIEDFDRLVRGLNKETDKGDPAQNIILHRLKQWKSPASRKYIEENFHNRTAYITTLFDDVVANLLLRDYPLPDKETTAIFDIFFEYDPLFRQTVEAKAKEMIDQKSKALQPNFAALLGRIKDLIEAAKAIPKGNLDSDTKKFQTILQDFSNKATTLDKSPEIIEQELKNLYAKLIQNFGVGIDWRLEMQIEILKKSITKISPSIGRGVTIHPPEIQNLFDDLEQTKRKIQSLHDRLAAKKGLISSSHQAKVEAFCESIKGFCKKSNRANVEECLGLVRRLYGDLFMTDKRSNNETEKAEIQSLLTILNQFNPRLGKRVEA